MPRPLAPPFQARAELPWTLLATLLQASSSAQGAICPSPEVLPISQIPPLNLCFLHSPSKSHLPQALPRGLLFP